MKKKLTIASHRIILIGIAVLAMIVLIQSVHADSGNQGIINGWGNDGYGQATPPAGNDYVAIAGGAYHSLALKSDGSIVGWGYNAYGQATPPAGNDYVAIAGGLYHSLALKSDGSIVGWGRNNNGQATPPAGNDYVAIAAGDENNLALKSDGSIVGWGPDFLGQATPPAGNNYVAIAARFDHSLALKSDGSIIGWGRNNNGQATAPSGNKYVAIAAGSEHSLALKSDGSIVGWGYNAYGQATPPSGNDYVAIAAGSMHSLALKSDGSIVGWGENSNQGQATPPAGNHYVAIAAGYSHSLAIKSVASPPTTSFNFHPTHPISNNEIVNGGEITFEGFTSRPLHQTTEYEWDFGDGVQQIQHPNFEYIQIPFAQHVYSKPGDYQVKLTVSDYLGGEETRKSITVKNWQDDLQEGDILFDPDFVVKLQLPNVPISLTLTPKLGHTGIFVGQGNVIEAHPNDPIINTDEGVRVQSIDSWNYPNRKNVFILRVKTSQENKKNAQSFALRQVGDKYDYLSIAYDMKQNDPTTFNPLSRLWYCHELVWASYLYNNGKNIEDSPDQWAIYGEEIYYSPNIEKNIGGHLIESGVSQSDLLWILADCPVDLKITDPDGLEISKESNEILSAQYIETDLDVDGSPDDLIYIEERKIGDYSIQVIPDPSANPTDTYTLKIWSDQSEVLLANNVALNQVPDGPYKIQVAQNGEIAIPVKVRIVPNTLNTASKGKFVAFITLPSNYKAADVDAKSVVCEGVPALRLIRIKAFPNTFAAIFNREKLVNLKPGDKAQLTVTGTINKNGQKVGFSGSDLIKIVSKKGTPKEAIDDLEKMTDEKVFSQFNPR